MAEDGDKTEQPTEKKLRDAREKGQVALSQDVTATATIIAAFASLWLFWDMMMEHTEILFALSVDVLRFPFRKALFVLIHAGIELFFILVSPVLFLTMIAAILGVILQVGFLFALESVKPSLDKLNPKQYFTKVFSKKGLVELVKTFGKLGVLSFLLYIVVVDKLYVLLEIPLLGKEGILYALKELMIPLVLMTILAFTAIAIFDFIFQRRAFMKDMMMSMDEIKREMKESDGNPEIKGQRKQLHHELVMSDTEPRVKQSNVVVTNPTHLSIALYYKSGKTDLPIITAMGENYMALRIREIAEENGIPIMRNVPLARGLYVEGRIDHYIPAEFIEPVAEIMRWVQQIEQEKHSY
ncbi:MAG: type III secretion system export apparatus subunit SctU [Desulfovibrionaceae bacterium]|nr:type III secretion system export apparatus subunit SctU [Desulfovibrionaceae bacterium]